MFALKYVSSHVTSKKTDSLLYELIPASVAEELKEGLRVPAQNYDCVSIYFSDIVGFTSMSAQSTPLQVIILKAI